MMAFYKKTPEICDQSPEKPILDQIWWLSVTIQPNQYFYWSLENINTLVQKSALNFSVIFSAIIRLKVSNKFCDKKCSWKFLSAKIIDNFRPNFSAEISTKNKRCFLYLRGNFFSLFNNFSSAQTKHIRIKTPCCCKI